MGRPKRCQGVLTPREFEVLRLVAAGLEKSEIAESTGRTVHTIRSQVASMRERLGARNSAHAVSIAYERGYLGRDELPAQPVPDGGEVR